ncbi:MAG TPA: hypothetical protein DCE56_16870 [Cyanobacteria bacterium UBA8553]|nr:hypothetical protein [Cyanobacteria bacterium UBA8553]HAJ62253.1 hypothetical protein [Cyanobacteria bacterium UBA8543]
MLLKTYEFFIINYSYFCNITEKSQFCAKGFYTLRVPHKNVDARIEKHLVYRLLIRFHQSDPFCIARLNRPMMLGSKET